jgi:signal transduction histidine kinase
MSDLFPDPSAGDPSAGPRHEERARAEELGRVAAELLHDLASLTEALRARVRLAAGEARMGRLPLMEMDRVTETADDLGAMLGDVLEVMRGASISPEVAFDPHAVAVRAMRHVLPDARALEFRLDARLPDGLRVPGRESFMLRALSNMIAAACRQAHAEVRVTLAAEADGDARARLLVAVDDDGATPRASSDTEATLLGEVGARSAQWAVRQLGGTLAYARSSALGGTRIEMRLPCRLPRGARG